MNMQYECIQYNANYAFAFHLQSFTKYRLWGIRLDVCTKCSFNTFTAQYVLTL